MSEYPRALYLRGVAGEMRAVRSEAEEAAARAEGWLIYGERPEGAIQSEGPRSKELNPAKRRGRPRKPRT